MTPSKAIMWVERLSWAFIYGGLFTIVIGMAVISGDPPLGWALIIAGAVFTIAGGVLIWIRSRQGEPG
jgi:hypothetical protein